MKLTKYLLFACSALLLASCSNNDDWNTASDVTVQMANATMRVKENGGIFRVPLDISGKANGPIRVTVAVAEAEISPAVENENYVLTSKTVVIPEDDHNIFFEFFATNDMEINEDRVFTVTIENVEGAEIGEIRSTEITIRDDDSMFYEAIQGAWTFTSTDPDSETDPKATESYTVNIFGVEEDDENYEKVLYMSGLQGYSWVVTELTYNYDEETNTINLSIPFGQTIAEGVNFSSLGVANVVFAQIEGQSVNFTGQVDGVVSTNLKKITFDPDVQTTGAIFLNNSFSGYIWFLYSEMTLTR